jgi:hypothetical protein
MVCRVFTTYSCRGPFFAAGAFAELMRDKNINLETSNVCYKRTT